MATVSLRALKRRLPDLASLDHQGTRPQRNDMSSRSGWPSVGHRPLPPDLVAAGGLSPRGLVGGGDVPAGRGPRFDVVGQGGAEVAGDPGRRGIEGEASAHAGCIVSYSVLRRDDRPLTWLLPPGAGGHSLCNLRTYVRFSSRGPAISPSVRPAGSPCPGSSRPGWPTGSGPSRRWPGGPCRCRRRWPRSFPGGVLAPRDDHHRERPAGPRRDHAGAGRSGGGVGGRQLVRRRRPARPGRGGGRGARARSAPGRLRAPSRQRMGRGGRRPPLRRRRGAGASARPGPPRQARHLSARARDRQAALVVLLRARRDWPEGGDLALTVGAAPGKASGRATAICAGAGPRCASAGAAPPAGSPSARCGFPPARVRWRKKQKKRKKRKNGTRKSGRPGWAGPVPGRRRPERRGGEEGVERLVVIWCPELLEEGARGEEARRFARVVARAGELCPWVHPVRLGVCALPARGPARFFGGEEAVVALLAESGGRGRRGRRGRRALRRGAGRPRRADRPAGQGRRTSSHPGRWRRWRARTWPSPGSGWGSPPWASSPRCRRRASRIASARTRPPATRSPAARAGSWSGCATAPSSGGCGWPGARIPTGATRHLRPPSPASSAARRRLMPGRRAPSSRCRSAWASRPCCWAAFRAGATRPASRCSCPGAVPRQGRAPAPVRHGPGRALPGRPAAPTDVLRAPPRAELADAEGNAMVVSGRGLLTAPVDRLSVDGGPWEQVVGWAGSMAGDRALVVGAPAYGPPASGHSGRGGASVAHRAGAVVGGGTL